MKKVLFFTLLILLSLSAFAQKVKVKKDIIYLDETPVAKIEKIKDLFKIYNLDGVLQFTGRLFDQTSKGFKNGTQWIEITSADGTKKNEMGFWKYCFYA